MQQILLLLNIYGRQYMDLSKDEFKYNKVNNGSRKAHYFPLVPWIKQLPAHILQKYFDKDICSFV